VDSKTDIDPPAPSEKTGPTNRQLLGWMFQFIKPVKLELFLACLFLTCMVVAELYILHFSASVIDKIKLLGLSSQASEQGFVAWVTSGDPGANTVLLAIGFLMITVVGRAVFNYLREMSNMKFSMKMVYFIREAVYDKLQNVGFSFHDGMSSGQLINRALSDLQNVRAFIQTAILTSLDILLAVIGSIVLLGSRSGYLALLAVAPLPIWVWYTSRWSKQVQPAAKAVMEAEDKNVSLITEAIAGVHVIKAFATEQHEVSKYNSAADGYFGKVRNRIRMFANYMPVMRLISTLSHLSLFLLASYIILRGNMTVGDLIILGGAMGMILGRLQNINVISDQYQNAIVSARRLHEVLMAKPTVAEATNPQPLPTNGTGKITFDNVTFGYAPEKPVLKNLSFESRGVIAIIGPTGSGKTTLVNLIARFYDPQQGRILLDGVDLRDLDLSQLRKNVAFVFQETYLFSDTIEANIAYGKPQQRKRDDTPGEIEAAARLAQAHEFIETLPKGYHTPIGERGANLSGGQRQRLAIARAINADTRVLVLDDATAAVDSETEDLIRRAVKSIMSGRTVMLISNRIATVKIADLILVIENGQVTQRGTHDQLISQQGYYRTVALGQVYGDQEDPSDSPSHIKRMRQYSPQAKRPDVEPDARQSPAPNAAADLKRE
jgi:ABC-type multidrug transport system fused ATPase/permease subunit